MNEPIHKTRAEAIDWVNQNTDNTLFRSTLDDTLIRVDARGTVMQLRVHPTAIEYFWDTLRAV